MIGTASSIESLAATKQEPFSQPMTSLEWTTEDEAMLKMIELLQEQLKQQIESENTEEPAQKD